MYAYLRDTSWFDGPAMIWVCRFRVASVRSMRARAVPPSCLPQVTFGAQFVGHEDAFHHNLVVQDWCAPNDGTCTANFTIGQVCNGTLDRRTLAAPRATPPLGSNITLGPLPSLGAYVALQARRTER